jgi:hypothetical protein
VTRAQKGNDQDMDEHKQEQQQEPKQEELEEAEPEAAVLAGHEAISIITSEAENVDEENESSADRA